MAQEVVCIENKTETDTREGWEDGKLDVMVLFVSVWATIHDIL